LESRRFRRLSSFGSEVTRPRGATFGATRSPRTNASETVGTISGDPQAVPEADAAFVSSERTEWELHGSRTDRFARTAREEPLLGGLREPGNPTRRTQWQAPKPDEAHPPIAQPAPFR
jgi:hypothetical protein